MLPIAVTGIHLQMLTGNVIAYTDSKHSILELSLRDEAEASSTGSAVAIASGNQLIPAYPSEKGHLTVGLPHGSYSLNITDRGRKSLKMEGLIGQQQKKRRYPYLSFQALSSKSMTNLAGIFHVRYNLLVQVRLQRRILGLRIAHTVVLINGIRRLVSLRWHSIRVATAW